MKQTKPKSLWQNPNFVTLFVCVIIGLVPMVAAMFNVFAIGPEPFIGVPFFYVIKTLGIVPVAGVAAVLAISCGLLYAVKPAWGAMAGRILVLAAFLTMALVTTPYILSRGLDFSNYQF